MVSAVSSASTYSSASAASSASSVLASDFDTFLTLLTTQLQNQDPTAPMDANAFTEQLVQFSQVEQQINMNKNLESMLALMQSQQSSDNLDYVGKVVDVDSNETTYAEGGTAYWSYELPEGTASVQYNILDEDGNVVRTVSAADGDDALNGGRIELAWDGTDNNGNQLETGTYTLDVTAKDAQGQVLDGTKVYARGYVSALETIDGEQYLVVAGQKVLPEDVVTVYATGGSSSDSDDDA